MQNAGGGWIADVLEDIARFLATQGRQAAAEELRDFALRQARDLSEADAASALVAKDAGMAALSNVVQLRR